MIKIEDAWTNPEISWLHELVEAHQSVINSRLRNGDLDRWTSSLRSIPSVSPAKPCLGREVGLKDVPPNIQTELENALKGLIPWRKGPFRFGEVFVDTEWRSDLKWDRVITHLNLKGQRILDVGSGNGYHLWRMLDAGANEVLGIDPNMLFQCQFAAIKSLLKNPKAASIPVTLAEFKAKSLRFDTVFSMGVLCHRKDPIGHIFQLKQLIVPNGQLLIETLVIEGDESACLMPKERYARMNNIWFLPSVKCLTRWLDRAGFQNIKCLNVSTTTTNEQRRTDWMRFESFENVLDPNNSDLTVEGLPRPIRAAIQATAPVHN